MNINDAKNCLKNSFTCVLFNEDVYYLFSDKGIAPLLNIVNDGLDITGFILADKIVGKAVAMMAVKLNIKEVFAEVISESACDFLSAHNIPFSYENKTDYIVNRQNTGMCPMEETVKDIDDINLAITKLNEKVASLKRKPL